MDVRPALIIWRYLVAPTYQIVSKLLQSQEAGQELNYFMQMYASSCLIHQDFVEGRGLCRYSRWQEFGDIEYNITLQSAHSAYKTSGWNRKEELRKKRCTKQERQQPCRWERDGYESDVPAAKPQGPLCRGERRMQTQPDHICLKEFLNAWPYKFLGSLVGQ